MVLFTFFYVIRELQIMVMYSRQTPWRKQLLEPEKWSSELNSFVEICLVEDEKERITPLLAAQHKLVEKYKNEDPAKTIKPLLAGKQSHPFFKDMTASTEDEDQFWISEDDETNTLPNLKNKNDKNHLPIRGASISKLIEYATTGDSKKKKILA